MFDLWGQANSSLKDPSNHGLYGVGFSASNALPYKFSCVGFTVLNWTYLQSISRARGEINMVCFGGKLSSALISVGIGYISAGYSESLGA